MFGKKEQDYFDKLTDEMAKLAYESLDNDMKTAGQISPETITRIQMAVELEKCYQ